MARVALDTKQTGNQRCPKLSRCSLVGDQGGTPTMVCEPQTFWIQTVKHRVHFDEKRQCPIFFGPQILRHTLGTVGSPRILFHGRRSSKMSALEFDSRTSSKHPAIRISLRRLSIAEPVGTSKIISQIAARRSCLS